MGLWGGGVTSHTPVRAKQQKTQEVGLRKVNFIFLCWQHQSNGISSLKATFTVGVSVVFDDFPSPTDIPQDLQRVGPSDLQRGC